MGKEKVKGKGERERWTGKKGRWESENEKGKRWKGWGERSQVWRKGTGQRIERKESLKMKDCIIKKKVRKVNTQKVKHKRKSHKGK